MRTLSISTMGELKRAPISASSMGELILVRIIPPVDTVRRGGSSEVSHTILLARIKREDEEILAIIMSSMDLLE